MVNGKAKLIFGTGDIMMTPVLHSENNIPQYGMLAFSGGKDSQVLLDMTAWMWKKSEEEHGKKPLNVVFSNTSNEFAKMELFVKEYCDLMERKHDIKIRLYVVRGEKTYYEVVKDIGYPVVSKTTCRKVRDIRKWIKKEKIKWEDISDKLDNGIESANLLRKLGASNTGLLPHHRDL